jgi:hypothetical protein
MKKYVLIYLLLLAAITPVTAQFNPDQARKSLVKVIVTGGDKMGVCSGFPWKKKSWIVTSLHAMKPDGKIEIVYPGGNFRDAKVIRVFENADLVLLETNIDAKPVAGEVVPLSGYNASKPVFEEKIYAIGYHGGSMGSQTQPLEKGDAEVETLEFLLRGEKDLANLVWPSSKIPIYFLTGGSLLPGYSGSPIYNKRNELIGIGDGGLERGQMNVSWCIPASNLDLLVNSTVTRLPDRLADVANLYTAEVSIDVNPANAGQNNQAATQQLEQKYKSYSYGNFNFYQTKTRTLDEMVSTANNPENLIGFAKEFNDQKIFFDYNSNEFDFDIYEDVNNGFVIALPAGTTLSYDKDLSLFSADLPEDDDNYGYFNLFFGMEKHDGDPVGEIIKGFDEAFGAESKGLVRDPNYNRSYPLNREWRADYFVLQGNAPYKFDEDDEGEVVPNLFVSLISNDKEVFYSVALCFVPTDRPDIAQAFESGVDCINHYDENSPLCDYFGWFFHVIAASQLTTISLVQ